MSIIRYQDIRSAVADALDGGNGGGIDVDEPFSIRPPRPRPYDVSSPHAVLEFASNNYSATETNEEILQYVGTVLDSVQSKNFNQQITQRKSALIEEIINRNKYTNTFDALNAFFDYKIPRNYEAFIHALSDPIALHDFDDESKLGYANLKDEYHTPTRLNTDGVNAEEALENCGNACYLISMVHYLYHCVYFGLHSSKPNEIHTYTFDRTDTALEQHVRRFFMTNIHCDFFEPLFRYSSTSDKNVTKVRELTQSLFEFITSDITVNHESSIITVQKNTSHGMDKERRTKGFGMWNSSGPQVQNDANEAIMYFLRNLTVLGYSFENSVFALKKIVHKALLEQNEPRTKIISVVRGEFGVFSSVPLALPSGNDTINVETLLTGMMQPSATMDVFVESDSPKNVCRTVGNTVESLIAPTFIHVSLACNPTITSFEDFQPHNGHRNLFSMWVGNKEYNYDLCEIICKDSCDPNGGHYIHIGLRNGKWVLYNDNTKRDIKDINKHFASNQTFKPVSLMLRLVADSSDDVRNVKWTDVVATAAMNCSSVRAHSHSASMMVPTRTSARALPVPNAPVPVYTIVATPTTIESGQNWDVLELGIRKKVGLMNITLYKVTVKSVNESTVTVIDPSRPRLGDIEISRPDFEEKAKLVTTD